MAVLICMVALAYLCQPTSFLTTHYTLTSSKLENAIRIVHLSDLHNNEYGPENEELVQAVEEAKPDVIIITGDSVSRKDESIQPAVNLIEKLCRITNVYVSYGNHDVSNDERYQRDMGAAFEEAGAHVLDRAYEDIEMNGQTIRIGGIYGFCFSIEYLKTGDANLEECIFLKNFQNTENFTMLLAHLPITWLEHGSLDGWGIDSVFAGHSHGGQIVLPILGPVIAPDQGLFPEKVSGHFTSEDGTKSIIVSRGLGDSVKIPRVNNDPELVVVDVVPES